MADVSCSKFPPHVDLPVQFPVSQGPSISALGHPTHSFSVISSFGFGGAAVGLIFAALQYAAVKKADIFICNACLLLPFNTFAVMVCCLGIFLWHVRFILLPWGTHVVGVRT